MLMRMGTTDELRTLWGKKYSPTENYFVDQINNENMEFWTIENDDNRLIGELYIIWNSVDNDEANGIDRAYLCAFRINKHYQGMKLGSALMNRVIKRVKEKGFKEVTIGVDPDNADKLKSIYQSYGFTTFIKWQHYDNHYLNQNNEPVYFEEPSGLYLNQLR